MKNILVTGCGGAPTLSFTRSLRDSDPDGKRFRLIGLDCDKYTIHRNECDISYICPPAKDKLYIDFLLEIISKEKIDFIHTQPEIEVYVVGANRDKLVNAGCKLFMPKQETIEILRDKFKSYLVWNEKGIKVPRNIIIRNEDDLKLAFNEFGNEIWIRETIGAAGKGSLSRPTYALALAWINSRSGWGHTVAAEFLTTKTTTWQSIWKDGALVVGQGRERLYWEMSNRAQSGVTGVTGTGKISNDSNLADLAIKCIKSVDEKPNGIFSVDFTYDKNGVPNPTEINIGKFFTTHHFITRAGCNMPEIFVELAFDEYRGDFGTINPCKNDLYWIRGMDKQPKLVAGENIEKKEATYREIYSKLQK